MPLPIHDAHAFEKFFQAIAPLAEGYSDVDFRYLAIKQGDQWFLMQGRVIFASVPAMEPKKNFQSENIACGRYTFAELKHSPEQIAKELLTGKITLPDIELIFPMPQGGSFCTSYLPLHPSGLSIQSRYNAATIYGADVDQIVRQPLLEWELRANDKPYDTVMDLAADYKCGPLMSGAAAVEFAALQVVQTKYDSPVNGTKATPTLLAAKTVNPKKVSMGYRILSKGTVAERGNLKADAFSWQTEEHQMVGTASLTVPEAAIIQCFAKYNGIVQHHAWIHDKATTQNPRRSVYEGVDPNFDVLKELLGRRGKGKDAREFESGVAWLLWMLGFNMVQFGHMPNTQEAPDLIASPPAGHYAVIECTTGQLKADHKLSLLVSRAQQIREKLAASNNSHIHVLPVIVTSLPRLEIRADLEQAERNGVLVMSKENLEFGLSRTITIPNPDQLYNEAEEQMQSAQAKYIAAEASAAI